MAVSVLFAITNNLRIFAITDMGHCMNVQCSVNRACKADALATFMHYHWSQEIILRDMQLRSLQILRAAAATSVVYFHIKCNPWIGSFGVDLFFVLSGFVIMMAAEKNASPIQFAFNRLTRVVPLYWIMTTGVLLVAIISPALLNSTTANLGNYWKSLFFIPYFKENGELHPMLAVGWSLNYEMLFYTLATAALAIGASRFFYVATALVVGTYVVGGLLPDSSPYAEFLRTDLLFEFILGMLAFKLKDMEPFSGVPKAGIASAILCLFCVMAFYDAEGYRNRLLEFGLPSFFIVMLALELEPLIGRLNATAAKLLVHLGDASYATYLSHFFVVEFVRKIVDVRLEGFSIYTPVGVAFTVALSLLVGSLIYLFVDKAAVKRLRKAAFTVSNWTFKLNISL